MVTKKFVKICPKCGSTDVAKVDGLDYCQNCKNQGHFPSIEKSKQKYFQELLAAKD